MNACAGIVLYNPDIDRLQACIDVLEPQITDIVLIDNGSKNVQEIDDWFQRYKGNITLLKNNENKGIAAALNQILNYALQNGYEWFLTLDQDSIVNPGLIEEYERAVGKDIGQICCNIVDRNTDDTKKYGTTEGTWEEVDCCITSGTLNNSTAIKQVGGFKEFFFIDGVDMDISYTLSEHGYRIVKTGFYGLLHELGKRETRSILGRKIVISKHTPWRNYYARRNLIWVARSHYTGKKRIKEIGRQIVYGIGSIILENEKGERFHYNMKGIFDGILKK